MPGSISGLRRNDALLNQVVHHLMDAGLQIAAAGVDFQLGLFRGLIGAGNAGEFLDLPGPGLGIQPLGVALLAGVGAAVGVIATYVGIWSGSTAVVATLGGMYFVIAALLSVIIFDEPFDLQTMLGIGWAIMAIVVLTTGR